MRSELDCQHFCSLRGRCKYYTWFNQLDTDFKFYCFLYSDCIIEDTACVGCRSGPDTCFDDAENWEQFYSTTTTTQAPNTTCTSTTDSPATLEPGGENWDSGTSEDSSHHSDHSNSSPISAGGDNNTGGLQLIRNIGDFTIRGLR